MRAGKSEVRYRCVRKMVDHDVGDIFVLYMHKIPPERLLEVRQLFEQLVLDGFMEPVEDITDPGVG